MEQEKDAIIADLRQKLDNIESDYEKILHVSFNTSQFNHTVWQQYAFENLHVYKNLFEVTFCTMWGSFVLYGAVRPTLRELDLS